MNERLIAYDTKFDRDAYKTNTENESLNAYTKTQLETHLAERFNVLLSQTHYGIRNGQIYGENMNEPFLDSMIRGKNYRREHGDPVDFDRENAEVIGFARIEEKLINPDTEIGTMMLSISPKGGEKSIYQHNFYDVFTLKQNESGKYVQARRYSSGLTLDETTQKLSSGLLLYSEDAFTPELLLANPIEIKNPLFKTADDLHQFLHKEHKYTKREEFDEGLKKVGFLVTSYVNCLSENLSASEVNMRLNAVLNGFDVVMGESIQKTPLLDNTNTHKLLNSREYIVFLGQQPVRPVMTGCGISGDTASSQRVVIPGQQESSFSISEFGKLKDKYGERTFDCPECGKKNLRPDNQLIEKCQHCKSSKVAC